MDQRWTPRGWGGADDLFRCLEHQSWAARFLEAHRAFLEVWQKMTVHSPHSLGIHLSFQTPYISPRKGEWRWRGEGGISVKHIQQWHIPECSEAVPYQGPSCEDPANFCGDSPQEYHSRSKRELVEEIELSSLWPWTGLSVPAKLDSGSEGYQDLDKRVVHFRSKIPR